MRLVGLQKLMARVDLPPGLFWSATLAKQDEGALFAEERKAMARAVPARKAEFTGGRKAARTALSKIGMAPGPIPMRPDRLPVFPQGSTGGITHCDGLCLAIVAKDTRYRAIGVDIETAEPLDHTLLKEVTRDDENPGGDPLLTARRRFSAKEAVFKAQYPITSAMFGFHALHLDLETGIARFADHPESASIPASWRSRSMEFSQWEGEGLILSLCLIAA